MSFCLFVVVCFGLAGGFGFVAVACAWIYCVWLARGILRLVGLIVLVLRFYWCGLERYYDLTSGCAMGFLYG